MALQVTVAEDGTLQYVSDGHVVLTGPIQGNVTLPDGTVYNVAPAVIEAPLEHHGAISHAIGVRHQNEGHPGYTDDVPFVHTCSDHCGGK